MMRLAQTRVLFSERLDELTAFIGYLEKTESELLDQTSSCVLLPSPTVTAVMKATVLVMNYSLVEALIVELVDETFSIANSRGVCFSRLSPHLRKQLVGYRFRSLRDAGVTRIQEVVADMIDEAISNAVVGRPDKQTIRDGFLGNLDAKKVRDVANRMGIQIAPHRRSRGGCDLKEMKDSRNKLAHGHVSFEDLGQLKTVSDLRIQTRRIVEYLLSVVRSFEHAICRGDAFS